jgi:putative phosphoesterase
MKIGIISDTHDDVRNLQVALDRLRTQNIVTVFHCGDVCGPEVIQALEGFNVWVAQGNMDRHRRLAQAIEESLGRTRFAWLHEPTMNGHPLALIHGDNEEVLGNLVTSGNHAYVFHGHTHRRRDQMIGRTRVINPGALGGTRKQSYSFCVLDLATGNVRFVEL